MLSKKQRILKKQEISEIFQKGRCYCLGTLCLKVIRREGGTATRVGVAVGVAYSKKAVERNRLKRQLSARVKEVYPQIKTGLSIVFFTNRAAREDLDKKKLAIGAMIDGLVKKSNILK